MTGSMSYISYDHTGWGAEKGEQEKEDSWEEVIKRKRELVAQFSSTWYDTMSILVARGLLLRLRRAGLNAFETCSMQTTMITRWVPRGARDTSYLGRQLECEFCTRVCKCA
eukprot:COSAG02_NODE_5502_length_4277_cov_2.983964_2_plen_111_part_00